MDILTGFNKKIATFMRFLIKISIIIVFFFSYQFVNAQTNSKQDSLLSELNNTTIDSSKVRILIELGSDIQGTDTSKAIIYFQEAIQISEKSDNKQLIARCLGKIGNIYVSKYNYYRAIDYYKKSLRIATEIDDKICIIIVSNNMADINRELSNYIQAFVYYQEMLKISKEIDDKIFIISSLNGIANIYNIIGEYSKALDYYQKALRISEKIENKMYIAICYGNIAITNTSQGNDSIALMNYQKALKIFKEIGDKEFIANSLMNIGDIYYQRANYFKALEYYQKSLKLYEEIADKLGISFLYTKISAVYFKTYFYSKALDYANKSLTIANELNILDQQEQIHQIFSDIYAATNDYEKAYKNHVLYKSLNDSILGNETAKEILKIEFEYQAGILEQNNIIQKLTIEKQKNTIKYFIAGIIIIVLLASLILFFWYKKKRAFNILFKQNKQIVMQQKLLEKTKKIKTSKLDDNLKQQIWETITDLFYKQKIYLNSVLTVNILAEKINSNKTYISQVINEFSGEHFNNFVNLHRINDARKILSEPQNNIQIKVLHSEVGFKSKTTFYNSFKKITGFSPTQYRNKILQQNS